MATTNRKLISVVVPVFNEAVGINGFHQHLQEVLGSLPGFTFEIIYCDDGSTDHTLSLLRAIAASDPRVKVIRFTRNFGKEMATTAGIRKATGDAVVTLDADGQHPIASIPRLIEKWQAGNKLIIGVRQDDTHTSVIKKFGSKVFYRLINKFSSNKMEPRSTDFRLIDQEIQRDFAQLSEHNRITRGLIDWLGYRPEYLPFRAEARQHGSATYTFGKLSKLAIDGIIASSLSPLYITALLGVIVLPLSILLCLILVGNTLLGDPLGWHVTGTAYLVAGSLFLISLIMMSQGVIGLYLSHVYSETQNRPLYIVDNEASINL